MKQENFSYRTYCEFSIVSKEIFPEDITKELAIFPDRTFRKNEKAISKHSGSVITKPHNLWAIRSPEIVSNNEDISEHIAYFKSILKNKMNLISKLKNDSRLELIFWIWIETDNVGIGMDLLDQEINFINSISKRLHFSFIAGRSILRK